MQIRKNEPNIKRPKININRSINNQSYEQISFALSFSVSQTLSLSISSPRTPRVLLLDLWKFQKMDDLPGEELQEKEEGNDEEWGMWQCISREAARSESTNATIIAWTVLTYYISIVFYYQRTHTCWYDCLCSHCHSRRTLKNIGEQKFSVYLLLLGSLEAFVLLRRDTNM